MNRLIKIFLLILTASIGVCAQSSGSGTTLIKTETGILWVHNEDDAYFMIEIKGAEIEPMREYPFLRVDGRPMQLRLVPIEDFLNVKKPRPKDNAILKAHQDWEAEHHSKLLNTKLTLHSETIQLGTDREALFWDYENPPQMRRDFAAQSFLVTALSKHLLLLNSPRLSDEAPNAARNFLVATLSTLQVSSTPINVNALQESIRSGGGKIPMLDQSGKSSSNPNRKQERK